VALEFLQSQLETALRRRDQERSRVDILRRSLELYTQRTATPVTDSQGTKGAIAGGQQVISQVDKSFVDQLSDLISQKRDIEYRQRLVDSLNIAAINQLLPAETEASYYQALVQSMKSSTAAGPPSPELEKTIQSEYQKALSETYKGADQVSDIYALLSKNLNPGLIVYTLTDPVEQTTARAFSMTRLMVYGVLLMVIAVPLVLLAALLHNRIQEEKEIEESLHSFSEAEPDVRATTRTSPTAT